MPYRYRTTDTRSSGSIIPLSVTTETESSKYYITGIAPTFWNTSTNCTRGLDGSLKEMLDFVTPRFRYLIANGHIINNRCSKTNITYEDPLVGVEYSEKHYYWKRPYSDPTAGLTSERYYTMLKFGVIPLSAIVPFSYLPAPPAFDVGRISALAITEAYANINNSELLLNAAIAESGKTTRDLLSLARKVINVVRAVKHPRPPKRFNIKALKSAAEEAEQLYMQARYNLRPLYYDILGVMKLTVNPRFSPRYTYRGTASDEDSTSSTVSSTSSNFPGLEFGVTKTSSFTAEARAGVLTSVPDSTVWERTGIALISETIWELTPFSFILDWFGNFGSVISSWAPSPGVKVLASWLSVSRHSTQEFRLQAPPSKEVIYTPIPSIGKVHKKVWEMNIFGETSVSIDNGSYSRTINPDRPFTPRLELNLDSLKCLDLAIIGKNLLRNIRS